MRARDVMTTEVITASPETSVTDAAHLMLDRHISGLPVVDEGGRLVGMLSEGDLMRRAELITERRPWWRALASSAEEQARAFVKAHALKVRDVMTKDVITVEEHEPLDRIAMLFEERAIKRAPVLRGAKIIGIVSRANLLQGFVTSRSADPDPGDDAIRSAILTRVREEAGVRNTLLSVTVADGVVHLWGNLASESERDAVRVAAETTDGAKDVQDHTRLMPPTIASWKPE